MSSKPSVKPDERHTPDAEMCWCTECIRKLIEANDEYMQRWLDRRSADDEPVSGHVEHGMSETFTKDELQEFDRLTMLTSSRDQMDRIQGRFNLRTFVEKHGKAKCDAMFAELRKDGKT